MPFWASRLVTAFNDVVAVRVPGHGMAAVAVHVNGRPFISYSADAVIVATTTGSTAYSFSAGGPIVSPAVEALLVTPAAPHSAYNRGVVLSLHDPLALAILPATGSLAVEVDVRVAAYAEPGQRIDNTDPPGTAGVVGQPHSFVLVPDREIQCDRAKELLVVRCCRSFRVSVAASSLVSAVET
jgi:NAD+ kinase